MRGGPRSLGKGGRPRSRRRPVHRHRLPHGPVSRGIGKVGRSVHALQHPLREGRAVRTAEQRQRASPGHPRPGQKENHALAGQSPPASPGGDGRAGNRS